MGNASSTNQQQPHDPNRRPGSSRKHSEKDSRSSPARTSLSSVASATPRNSTHHPHGSSSGGEHSKENSTPKPIDKGPTGGPGQPPHPSLRTKKRSLELPDLAALALSPSTLAQTHSASTPPHPSWASPTGRPRPSEPIPIPASAARGSHNADGEPTSPATARGGGGGTVMSDNRVTEALVEQTPSTHIPIPAAAAGGVTRGRVPNPHTRGALSQPNSSTRSFFGQQQQQQHQETPRQRGRQPTPPRSAGGGHRDASPPASGFVGEEVRSSIPLGLIKAEDERTAAARGRGRRKREDTNEPKEVLITWTSGGKTCVLARAGDDNWQGRTPMDYDEATGKWTTWVSLMPGTHHIKFIVDEIWRLDETLPTAVDDDGSLANYVAVPLTGSTPPIVPILPNRSAAISGNAVLITSLADAALAANTQANAAPSVTAGTSLGAASLGAASLVPVPSLWSEVESSDGSEGDWTDELPRQLINAAREEEIYLAHGVHADRPAPDIPPAPLLPRHLDKLILNVRPVGVHGRDSSASRHGRDTTGFGSTAGSTKGSISSTNSSGRMRSVMGAVGNVMGSGTRGRSALGMTSSANSSPTRGGSGDLNGLPTPDAPIIPVTTASGTDVTMMAFGAPSRGIGERVNALGHSPSRSGRTGSGTNVALGYMGQADDGSVLPVPSHAVLQHLATSAIRHGVLAVGNSIRYKKKFITVIYYKPI